MRLLKIGGFFFAIVVVVILLLPPSIHSWKISDPSFKQTKTFSDWFNSWSTGLLAIRVTGNLSSPAQLVTPLGTIHMEAGYFDLISYAHESWSNRAQIVFNPSTDTKGEIEVLVTMGYTPDWVLTTPTTARKVLPER